MNKEEIIKCVKEGVQAARDEEKQVKTCKKSMDNDMMASYTSKMTGKIKMRDAYL